MTYENVIMNRQMKYEMKHFSNEHSENATGEPLGIKCSYSNEFFAAARANLYPPFRYRKVAIYF